MKIATNDKLKIDEGPQQRNDFETAVVKGVEYVRDPEGTWRYSDSWLKVPGARDWTLTERFKPKMVIATSDEGVGHVERIVISGEEIEKHSDLLGWVMEVGYPVQGPTGEVFEVMVPFGAWQEHDRIPGMIHAPELHGSEAERELAQAEREYREADRNLEEAAAKRAEVLRRHSEDMTRQQARAITDLSVGRIQQLIREGVEGQLDQIDRALLATAELRRPRSRKELHELTSKETEIVYPTELIRSRIINLLERGLLRHPRGKWISLTPEGREALMGMGHAGRDSEPKDD